MCKDQELYRKGGCRPWLDQIRRRVIACAHIENIRRKPLALANYRPVSQSIDYSINHAMLERETADGFR